MGRYNESEIFDFNKRINKWLNTENVSYVAEPKIDGLGVSLIYENGNLTRALTRGDGYSGEDITHNIRTINAIPLQLRKNEKKFPSFIEIRGEIFMLKDEFLNLNKFSYFFSSFIFRFNLIVLELTLSKILISTKCVSCDLLFSAE